MAALVDLDLNCCPPSPEPALPEEPRRAMFRQELSFPNQMDLPKLYLAQTNLTDGSFQKQSSDALRNPHSAHEHLMMSLDGKGNPDASGNSKKHKRHSGFLERNIDARNSVRIKTDVGVREKCGYRYVIDLEKPAASDDDDDNDDDVVVSCTGFGNLGGHNGKSQDNSRFISPENCLLAESGQVCGRQSASRVSPGSVGSSDTPDCQSPIKDNTESRHSLIDLNVPQEESLHSFYAPSQASCSPLVNSSSSQTGVFWNGSSKFYPKECDSSIGSAKESCITVVAPSSAANSSYHDSRSLQASGDNVYLGQNIQHHRLCGSSCQGCLKTGQQRFCVGSSGRNDSYPGLLKSGDNHVGYHEAEPPLAVHTELQHETSTLINGGEETCLFDLNVSLGSIDMPSTVTSNCRDMLVNSAESEGIAANHCFSKKNILQAETSMEHLSVRDHYKSASKDGNSAPLPISTNNEIDKVRSPDIGTVINRQIPETPHVDSYVWPRLRESHDGESNSLETVTGNDDKMVSIAAETLLSIFSHNSASTADIPVSDNQVAAEDGNDEPQRPLDSYEEILLNAEELRDDGESIPVIPPDMEGVSCGIKLRRGRGLRNFQREIMPGLVSLSRHEICDDLHAIGYEFRKTRSRKTCRDQGSVSTRGRPRKRGSTAGK